MGHIASSPVTLAVADLDGLRIGSGAATLNAIYALAKHYLKLIGLDLVPEVAIANGGNSVSSVNNEDSLIATVKFMAQGHILLLHAGGDSKRVPWANPMGKVFLPLPYLAADGYPDEPVPLLLTLYFQLLLVQDKL